MKARPGQIALFLIAVLVAIAVLVLMNVNVFLSIRAKNHATSAGDAAALAVAEYQGELLNAIGRNNIATLKAALANDLEKCQELERSSRETCFLGPIHGIGVGNRAAVQALSDVALGGGDHVETFYSDGMRKILERLVSDVRNVYAMDEDLYPAPWEGAWVQYADTLQSELGGDFVVGPENAEFATAFSSEPLLDQEFYNAIAGRMWCWFLWGRMWIFDCDSHNMPRPVFSRDRARDNCEIYPLHLTFKALPASLDRTWRTIIKRLAGCTDAEIDASQLLTSGAIKYAFFDSRWGSWSDAGFNERDFPIVGPVKAQYDVLGCAALCRVQRSVPSLTDGGAGKYNWVAGAKPFGTVESLEGETDVVTALNGFVTPCFTDVRLVPIDAVGGEDLHTADADWMTHIQAHLLDDRFGYFVAGPNHYALRGCWYCQQLKLWENSVFRAEGQSWLKYNASDCRRPGGGGGGGHGGTAHAH